MKYFEFICGLVYIWGIIILKCGGRKWKKKKLIKMVYLLKCFLSVRVCVDGIWDGFVFILRFVELDMRLFD